MARSCAAKSAENGSVPLGDVGYTFYKFFPGHGYYKGRVVKIRPRAAGGKTRRCRYTDGDEEDLSLQDLRALARRSSRKRYAERIAETSLQDRTKRTKTSPSSEASSSDSSDTASSKSHLASPLRLSFSSTNGASSPKRSKVVPSSTPSMDGLASLMDLSNGKRVGAKVIYENDPNRTVGEVTEETINGYVHAAINGSTEKARVSKFFLAPAGLQVGDNVPSSPVAPMHHMDDGTSLVDVSIGERLGLKVFNIDDANRIVGVVTKEGSHGWVHLAMNGSTQRGRLSKFALAPPGLKVGDSVPSSVEVKKPIDHTPHMDGLAPLMDVSVGERRGVKVVYVNDANRTVGEVAEEANNGWVHVAINGSTKKERVSKFFLAPAGLKVGDSVTSSEMLSNDDSPMPNMDGLASLLDVAMGERFGVKVCDVNDTKQTVGEVMEELGGGWVHVSMCGSVQKIRVSKLLVADEDLNASLHEDGPVSLKNVRVGKRIGTTVFDIEDENRSVGKVTSEIGNGWVNVAVDGSTRPVRVNKLFVASLGLDRLPSPTKAISIDGLVSLMDVRIGERRGTKVVNRWNRTVGEVVKDVGRGWVHVAVEGSTVKARLGHLYVAPPGLKVGESVSSVGESPKSSPRTDFVVVPPGREVGDSVRSVQLSAAKPAHDAESPNSSPPAPMLDLLADAAFPAHNNTSSRSSSPAAQVPAQSRTASRRSPTWDSSAEAEVTAHSGKAWGSVSSLVGTVVGNFWKSNRRAAAYEDV